MNEYTIWYTNGSWEVVHSEADPYFEMGAIIFRKLEDGSKLILSSTSVIKVVKK